MKELKVVELSRFLGLCWIIKHFCSQSPLPLIASFSWPRLNLVLCFSGLLGDQIKRECSSLFPSPSSNHCPALFLIHCWPFIIIIIRCFLWKLNWNRFRERNWISMVFAPYLVVGDMHIGNPQENVARFDWATSLKSKSIFLSLASFMMSTLRTKHFWIGWLMMWWYLQ